MEEEKRFMMPIQKEIQIYHKYTIIITIPLMNHVQTSKKRLLCPFFHPSFSGSNRWCQCEVYNSFLNNKTRMSHQHLALQGDFFHPAPHPELNDLTTSDTHRAELLDAALLQPRPPSAPSPSTDARFYDEYKRIYLIAFSLQGEKRRLHEDLQALQGRLRNIEARLAQPEGRREGRPFPQAPRRQEASSDDNRNKRSRRTAEEIEKKHQCHAHQCERYYGSEGSLQQHIKLKHPELLRKSQRGESSDGEGEDVESDFMPLD